MNRIHRTPFSVDEWMANIGLRPITFQIIAKKVKILTSATKVLLE